MALGLIYQPDQPEAMKSRIKKVKNRCATSLIEAKLLPEIIHFFVTKKSKKELDQKNQTATT